MENSCLLCGSSEYKSLYKNAVDRLGLYSREFDILECLNCGTARIDKIPTAEELANLYPADYIIKPGNRHGHFMEFWADAEMKLFYEPAYRKDVLKVLKATGIKSGKVLDVGCGNGGRMKVFSEMGFEAEGIETSKVDVDYINNNLKLKANLGALTDIDFIPGSYSAITFFNVFEHLPNPADVAQKAFSLLKPGGFIVISGPFMDSLKSKVFGRKWTEVVEMPRHIFIPSTKGLEHLLGQIGFSGFSGSSVGPMRLAHTMAATVMPSSINASAYRKGPLFALANRAAGASVMLLSIPAAVIEYLSGRACTRVLYARKPEDVK